MKKGRKKNSGTTLVEVMTAFAIAAVFMAAATALISSYTNIFQRVFLKNRMLDISEVVLEKVVDEITYASVYEDKFILSEAVPDGDPAQPPFYTKLQYSNRNGNQVNLSAVDGELVINYEGTDTTESGDSRDSLKWFLDKKFYKKCKIDLQFQQFETTNKIRIKLKITNDGTPYTRTIDTYAECIQLSSVDIKGDTGG